MPCHIPVDARIDQRIISFLSTYLHPHANIMAYHIFSQIKRAPAGTGTFFFHCRIACSSGIQILTLEHLPLAAQKTKCFVHPSALKGFSYQIYTGKWCVFKHFFQIFMKKCITQDTPFFIAPALSCLIVKIEPETFFCLCQYRFCLTLQPEMPCRNTVSFIFQKCHMIHTQLFWLIHNICEKTFQMTLQKNG